MDSVSAGSLRALSRERAAKARTGSINGGWSKAGSEEGLRIGGWFRNESTSYK